jgi:hypothetical protein
MTLRKAEKEGGVESRWWSSFFTSLKGGMDIMRACTGYGHDSIFGFITIDDVSEIAPVTEFLSGGPSVMKDLGCEGVTMEDYIDTYGGGSSTCLMRRISFTYHTYPSFPDYRVSSQDISNAIKACTSSLKPQRNHPLRTSVVLCAPTALQLADGVEDEDEDEEEEDMDLFQDGGAGAGVPSRRPSRPSKRRRLSSSTVGHAVENLLGGIKSKIAEIQVGVTPSTPTPEEVNARTLYANLLKNQAEKADTEIKRMRSLESARLDREDRRQDVAEARAFFLQVAGLEGMDPTARKQALESLTPTLMMPAAPTKSSTQSALPAPE